MTVNVAPGILAIDIQNGGIALGDGAAFTASGSASLSTLSPTDSAVFGLTPAAITSFIFSVSVQ